MLGIVFTPEHRRKLNESAKRRTHNYSHSLETRQKHTEETKQKMRGPRGKLSHPRKPRSNLFLVSQIDVNKN